MNFADWARQAFWLASQALHWRPDEFWQSTPRELSDALRNPDGVETQCPPDRDLIQTMMERDTNGR